MLLDFNTIQLSKHTNGKMMKDDPLRFSSFLTFGLFGLFQVCSCIGIRALILPVSIAAIRGGREKAILQPEYEKLMQQQKVPISPISSETCETGMTCQLPLGL